jgi:predicted MFS family arabinose efflux permease
VSLGVGAMSVSARNAAIIFFAFAFAYFLSALLRAVTATLAPVFSAEFGLTAGDLGLLAGAYFLGFASLQLPLGHALDRFGPRRTLLVLLAVAVLGCIAFALAPNLSALTAARVLIGAGVAAGLMAPLTLYRRLFSPVAQLRANSWMLMTGSLGMLASTLPVQALLPLLGWRGLFVAVAAMLALAMLLIAALVPRDAPPPAATAADSQTRYAHIARHPLFASLAPLAFFLYGGMIAVQALWAGPWLTRVAGFSAGQAAQGLFIVNAAMLVAFGAWGAVMPRLARRGLGATLLITWGVPLPLGLLLLNAALGPAAGAGHWAAWCVSCTFVSLSQPAVGAAFPAAQAGRALSAFNLVIFSGVFLVQWGVGGLIDALRAAGLSEPDAYRAAMATLALCCALAYAWFLAHRPRAEGSAPAAAGEGAGAGAGAAGGLP